MRTPLIVCMLLAVGTALATAAPELPTKPLSEATLFFGFRNLLSDAQTKFGPNNPDLEKALTVAVEDSRLLEKRWLPHIGKVSPEYLMDLTIDHALLVAAMAAQDEKLAVSMCKNAIEDLGVKADHCRKTPEGLGEKIQVEVSTLKDGKQLKGLYVRCMLKGVADTWPGAKPIEFKTVSSPAKDNITPGRY